MSRERGVIIAGAAETDAVGKLPDHSTLQLHHRGRGQRRRRRGPDHARHRRHRHGQRAGPGPGRARARHHAGLDGRHRGRRHLVPAACPARRGGDPGRLCDNGPHHARRIGPVEGGSEPRSRAERRPSPASSRRPTEPPARPVDLHHPAAAVHEGIRAHPRAARLRRGRAAKVGRAQPAGHVPRAHHGRGRAGVAAGRLPVPPAGVLPGHRRRRRPDRHRGRPGGGLPEAARARARHRGVDGDADDLADGRLHRVAGVPAGGPGGASPRPASRPPTCGT